MGILATPAQEDFVARVIGLDLSKPPDDGDFGQVREASARGAHRLCPVH
jgi:hypothetical protein